MPAGPSDIYEKTMKKVFIAVASDPKGKQPLSSVAKEHDGLSELLEGLQGVDLIRRTASTARSLVEVFQKNRNEICIFHYAGHADEYGLMLDSSVGEAAGADSFASFVAQQEGLKLVFLNGCLTFAHAQRLIDVGVEAVIATREAINDDLAYQFSIEFYKSLAWGANVATAFKEASEKVRMNPRRDGEASRKLSWQYKGTGEREQLPWEMFPKEGSEWRLTEAKEKKDPIQITAEVPIYKEYLHPFLDRVSTMEKLEQQLEVNDPKTVRVLLKGYGGYGKSFIAREYMLRHRERYDAIGWVSMERNGSRLANQLPEFVAKYQEAGIRVVDNFVNYLNTLKGRVLLVVDGLDEKDAETDGFIRSISPTNNRTQFRIIITSRIAKKYVSVENTMEVDRFPKDEARELFKKYYQLDETRLEEEEAAIGETLEYVLYNPLLIIIAAQIAEASYSVRGLAAELGKGFKPLAGEVTLGGEEDDAQKVIGKLYDLSELSPEEGTLLLFSAIFSITLVSVEDLAYVLQGGDLGIREEAMPGLLSGLKDKGWLSNQSRRFYSIHALIEELFLARLREGEYELKPEAFRGCLDRLRLALTCKAEDAFERRVFIELADAVLDRSRVDLPPSSEETRLRLMMSRILLDTAGKSEEEASRVYLETAYQEYTAFYQDDALLLIELKDAFTYHYQRLGKNKYQAAVEAAEEAMQARESSLQPDSFCYQLGLFNQAIVYKAKRDKQTFFESTAKSIALFEAFISRVEDDLERFGQETEVLKFPESAVEVYRVDGMALEQDVSSYLIEAYDNVGDTLRLRINERLKAPQQDDLQLSEQDADKAETYLKRGVELGKKVYSHDRYFLRNYSSLGHLYLTLYRFKGDEAHRVLAQKYHSLALQICDELGELAKSQKSTFSSDREYYSRNVARAYQSAAEFYEEVGAYETALAVVRKAIEIREKTLHPDHHKLAKGSRPYELKILKKMMANPVRAVLETMNTPKYPEILASCPPEFEASAMQGELDSIKASFLDAAQPRSNKLFIHMAGLPGSGKSTYCKQHIRPLFEAGEVLFLGFDDVMEQISHYNREKEKDTRTAFKRWEIPARILGYEILAEAFERGLSVVLDNGGANPKHIDLIQVFKENGYRTEMYYLGGSPEELYPRIKQREEETKRHFPQEEMEGRYRSLQKNLECYKDKELVDKFVEVK